MYPKLRRAQQTTMRAGMDRKTALRLGKLPSEVKQAHTNRKTGT